MSVTDASPTPTIEFYPPATKAAIPAPLSAVIFPDASKSFKQVSGRVPFTTTFSADISGGMPPYTLEWDFDGDGKIDSSAAKPAPFVFTAPRAYTATLTVRDANSQETRAERRIVAFTAPQLPNWKYGVTAHLERRRQLYYLTLDDVRHAGQLMKDAGIQVVRVDFNWDMLNPTPKEWHFADYEAVVRIMHQYNIETMAIVDYVSWWASSAQDSQDWRVRLYSEPIHNYDFAQYTYELVSHFKNDVHVWQIWNEPNTDNFWKPKPNAAHYVALLQEAYLAAKYADPDAVVLFAGMSGNGIEGNDDTGLAGNFIEQAYQAGARGYFDAMAIHPYTLPNGGINALRDKIIAARNVMNQYGDHAIPLWLTEIGVPSQVPWWSTAPIQSEQDVANWLNSVYTQLWDLTPTIIWYQLQDIAIGDDPEGHFGLLRVDYSTKPAYDALRALTQH
ncbi:MAG TPA: hypothetical protein VFD70_13135 [Anaerolineae bacterium]|nr:hypothetical protein [Anaerolineae bacterium]